MFTIRSGAVVGVGAVVGWAGAASAVSVDVYDDQRQVQATLDYNGVPRTDLGADTDDDRFADLAEVLEADKARTRATQLSGYKPIGDDTFAMRSRNRVGFETLLDFAETDDVTGTAVSAFSIAFRLVDRVGFSLFASGGAPVEGDADVTGDYRVRLTGGDIDFDLRQDPAPAQIREGILEPGDYVFSVLATVRGIGPARVPVEVDGRLILSTLDDGGPGGGGNVIPTPAAGVAGLALLALAASRRRQRDA